MSYLVLVIQSFVYLNIFFSFLSVFMAIFLQVL